MPVYDIEWNPARARVPGTAMFTYSRKKVLSHHVFECLVACLVDIGAREDPARLTPCLATCWGPDGPPRPSWATNDGHGA